MKKKAPSVKSLLCLLLMPLLAACEAPAETRDSLADPGDFETDPTLAGDWYLVNENDPEDRLYLLVRGAEDRTFLVAVVILALDTEEDFVAVRYRAIPAVVGGRKYYSAYQIGGDEYHPSNEEKGFINVTYELTDDDHLFLRFLFFDVDDEMLPQGMVEARKEIELGEYEGYKLYEIARRPVLDLLEHGKVENWLSEPFGPLLRVPTGSTR
jgi:hypothetical protein